MDEKFRSDPLSAGREVVQSLERVSPEQCRTLSIVRRFGWNAMSFQVFTPGLSYWFADGDACVAYLDTGSAWVVAGAPLAAETDMMRVANQFCVAAKENSRRAVFVATERRFLELVGNFKAIAIGEMPVWDPADWSDTVAKTRRLREQLSRARNKGVRVRRVEPCEVIGPDPRLRGQIEKLISTWEAKRPLPPLGFVVQVTPLTLIVDRRTFVAEVDGNVVGFASVVPVFARNGWTVQDLVRAPNAPNGTVELLVDAAMRDAAKLGSHYVTLGLSPLSGDVGLLLSIVRTCASSLFDFAALRAFKAKFRPREWVPIYVAYPPANNLLLATYDCLVAMVPANPWRYGARALLRARMEVLRRV